MSGKSRQRKTKKPRPAPPENDLLDTYGVPSKLKKIVPTSKRKEDVFSCLRPAKGECLDYDISQTVLRMDVGDTLINVKDVHATYVPAPPVIRKKKKVKPPPSKFVNEVWLDQQTELQKQYRKDLRRNIKLNKIRSLESGRTMHNYIQSLVGPEWFQELSPKQLDAVDALECCIHVDIKNNQITSVQEMIVKLGLVPIPNHRRIKKALRLCCSNPVEFLLILYQIMDPQRKEYSLNDRLLLSSVVHLTMMETLRELHVRIPSPPRFEVKQEERPKKERKVKYDSPYLEPLIYKPYLRNHTGIYENPRIQRPESVYFSYIPSFLEERLTTDDIFELDLSTFDREDAEVLQDMRLAQLEYDRIHGDRVNLLRPTVRKQCDDVAKFYKNFYKVERAELVLPRLPTLNDSDDEECFCCEILEAETNTCVEFESQNCGCEQKCACSKKSRKFTTKCSVCLARERKEYAQRVIKGVTVLPNDTVIPIIETTILQKPCDCLQKYEDGVRAAKARNHLQGQKAHYVIGGVVMTAEGPVYIVSAALRKAKKKVALNSHVSEVVDHKEVLNTKVNSSCAHKVERNQQHVEEAGNRSDSDDVYCTCKPPEKFEKGSNTENIDESCTSTKEKGDSEEEDTSSACDCCEECKCKERSKAYVTPRCDKCQEKEKRKYIERIITGLKETTSHNLVPIIQGTRLLKTCNCLQNYAEKILSMEARNIIQSQNAQFVIGGVVFTKMGPVYVLSTALRNRSNKPKRKRSCSKDRKSSVKEEEKEEEEEEEEVKYSGCKCKEELEKFLSRRCVCDRPEEATYIYSGTRTTVDGNKVNVVQGVYGQTCDCLEKHKEKMDRLEQYRQRIEARFNLKSQILKYSIGGVVNTAEGPVYVITGMRPPIDCECAKVLRRKEEEELRLQQMAKMPPTGRIKYQIAGVTSTPDGNVFVISQAVPTEDCDCEKLYDTYIQAHKACLDAYEDFLKQTQKELEQYMADGPPLEADPIVSQLTGLNAEAWIQSLNPDTTSETSVSNYNLLEHGEVVRTVKKKCNDQKFNICNRLGLLCRSEDSLFSDCVCDDDGVEWDTEESDSTTGTSLESLNCRDFCLQDLRRNNSIVTEVEVKPVPQKETEPQLKRFVILEELPENPKKQIVIIKNVLEQMAKDGFPLAKLPECHKLPHFKLWMQLRRGKIWTHKEIGASQGFSKWGWCHTDICKITYTSPVLGICKTKAANMTWRDAKYIRNLIADKTEGFYRDVSRNAVDRAREFFPLTLSYEFPNKTFRDVYFAYLPSKERDTLAFRIVKPSDNRIISKKYSCYC